MREEGPPGRPSGNLSRDESSDVIGSRLSLLHAPKRIYRTRLGIVRAQAPRFSETLP